MFALSVLLPNLSVRLFYNTRKFWNRVEKWFIWKHLTYFVGKLKFLIFRPFGLKMPIQTPKLVFNSNPLNVEQCQRHSQKAHLCAIPRWMRNWLRSCVIPFRRYSRQKCKAIRQFVTELNRHTVTSSFADLEGAEPDPVPFGRWADRSTVKKCTSEYSKWLSPVAFS